MDNCENDSDSSTSWVFIEKSNQEPEAAEDALNSVVQDLPELTRETVQEVNAYFDCANSENQSESDISVITDSEGNCSFDEDGELAELLKNSSAADELQPERFPLEVQEKKPEVKQQKPVFNLFIIVGIVFLAYICGQFLNTYNLSTNTRPAKTKSYFFMQRNDEDETKTSYDYDDHLEATESTSDYESLADESHNKYSQSKYLKHKESRVESDANKNKIHRKRHDENNKKQQKLQVKNDKKLKEIQFNDSKTAKKKDWKKKYFDNKGLQTDGDDASKRWKKYKGEPETLQEEVVPKKSNKKLKKMQNYLSEKEKYLLMKEYRLWKNERRIKMIRNAIVNSANQNKKDKFRFKNGKFVDGDWYSKLHKNRAKSREEDTKSDWLFDRARMRTNKRVA